MHIFLAFLKLGLTSFGGPIAHFGYLRDEFVVRRRWIGEAQFAELLALTQFLPGPASSQLGFSIGVFRGGVAGGIAAWLGFTLPSAVALVAFARGAAELGTPAGAGALQGLQVVAVAVVAHAVWSMAPRLCPDRARATIAVTAAMIVLLAHSAAAQVTAIAAGAIAGLATRRGTREPRDLPEAREAPAAGEGRRAGEPVSRVVALASLAAFATLLVALPAARALTHRPDIAVISSFYRAGALVFGGGHVVLPLLETSVVEPGWVAENAFLAGYGAAQAVPGPLFTFAAHLGALIATPGGPIGGAATALVSIFLPGLLLVLGVLPYWTTALRREALRVAVDGANAAVVGVLLAALYHPVWTSGIRGPADFALALVGFVLLARWNAPPWAVVLLAAAAGAARGAVA